MSWALALMGAGALVSAIGAERKGQAAKQAAEYNAQVAENNAIMSQQEAVEEERRKRSFMKRQMGSMRASYGASGVAMEGSPLEVLQDSAAQAELEALTIRHRGELQALGYRQQAQLSRMEGSAAEEAGHWGAAASLLGFAGNYAKS